MEVPIYEETLFITNIEDSDNEAVKTFLASNETSRCKMQYYAHLLNLSNINKIDLIIYKNYLKEEGVPIKYQYLTQGPIYKVKESEKNIEIFVSFHGCLLEFEMEKSKFKEGKYPTDADVFMVGVSTI
ncbi:hypothetical protein CDIK_1055 [Cucumispora dikerogammari]|nr:hypothetical protein CDIK_1055 [Cucumispora dikerogammari]